MARANVCSHTIPRHRHTLISVNSRRHPVTQLPALQLAYDELYEQQKITIDPATRVQIVKDTQRTLLAS